MQQRSSINTQTVLTKSGITIDYDDPSRQLVTFDDGTFSINKGLTVYASTILNEKLTVVKEGKFENSLRVDGPLILTNAITAEAAVGHSLIVNGSSRFNGSANLDNTLIVDKKVNLNDALYVELDTAMKSTLIVGGQATLNSNVVLMRASGNALVVNGPSKLKEAVALHSSMEVANPTTFSARVDVYQPTNMNNPVFITKSDATALTVTGTTNLKGPAIFGSSIKVGDASYMGSTFKVQGPADINNYLTITKADGEALHVAGAANLVGIAVLQSTLSVANDATLNSTLVVSKKATFQNELDVHKAAHLKSSLIVDGYFDPKGGIQLSSSGGGLTIGGGTDIAGAVHLESSLEVEGNTTLHANLNVIGHSALNSSVIITLDPSKGDALTVNGSTKLHGVAAINSSMSVSSEVNLSNILDVTGASNLHNAFEVAGTVLMSSSLKVDKLADLKDGLVISRVSAGDALSVVGSSNVSGNVNISSFVDISGAVHLFSSLEVDKQTQMNSSLHITLLSGNALIVAGDASLKNPVTYNSTLDVSKAVNMNDVITVAQSSVFNKGLSLSGSSFSPGSTLIVDGSSKFTGSTIFGSSLQVAGKSELTSILNVTEKTVLNNDLSVTGAAHLSSLLTVNSAITLNKNSQFNSSLHVISTGTSKFTNDVTMNNSLTVSTIANLSTVTISKTAGTALTIAGKSYFSDVVSIQSSLTVNGDITSISSTRFEVKDNAILIADDNQEDVVASGIIMKYVSTNYANNTSSIRYAGIKRVPVTGEFVFYKDSIDQIPNSDTLPVLLSINAVTNTTAAQDLLVAATVPLKESTLTSLNDAIAAVSPKLSAYNNAINAYDAQTTIIADALALKNSKNNDVAAANQLVISKRADYDAALNAERTALAAPYLPDVTSTLSSLNAAIAVKNAKEQIYNDTLLVQNNNARMGYGEYSTWSLGGSKAIDRVYVNVRPQTSADFGPREVKLLGSTNNEASWTLLSETVDGSGIVNYVSQEPPTYWTHFRVVYIEFNNSPGYMYNGKSRIMLSCEKYNGAGSLINFIGKVTASSPLDFDGSFYYQQPSNYDNSNVYSGDKYTLYYGGNGPTSQQISASVSAANTNLQSAISAKNTAQQNYDSAFASYNHALTTPEGTLRGTEITNTYNVWDSAVQAAAAAQSAYDSASSAYTSAVQNADLSTLTSNIAAAFGELQTVQALKNTAQAAYDAALLTYNNAIVAREQAIASASQTDYYNMEINAERLRKTDGNNFARIVAQSFNCASDARLKKNIVSLDGALDNIDKFNGVYHDWHNENQPERAIGVIAQDVQTVYPELVNESSEGFLAVNYPKLTAVLLQSVKELKSMVVNVIERRKAAAQK
jgi:hypothetical protein